MQYSLLNTTEISQGGNAGYGGVDLIVPNDLVQLMLSAGLKLAMGVGVDEMQNKAIAQPAWLQLAAGAAALAVAGSWGLAELGNINIFQPMPTYNKF